MNRNLKIVFKIALVLMSVYALYYIKSINSIAYTKIDIILISSIFCLAILLSTWKYLTWSTIFCLSIFLIIHENALLKNSNCSNIGCGTNGYAIVTPFIIIGSTTILLIIQFIQNRRNK